MAKKHRNHFLIFLAFTTLIFSTVYFIFIHPIGTEVYFQYEEKNIDYENGSIRIYLVNDNPENGSDNYFFRVTVKPTSEFYETCNLDHFNWGLRRESDNTLLFSTSTLTGQVEKSHFFENKIDKLVFKGISGKGLGARDFIAELKISPENKCGYKSNKLHSVHTMKLKPIRSTFWRRAMSV